MRYIALNDGYDSTATNSGYDLSTPIKEICNELYAADTSRKVRATKRLMAEQGKFSNSRAPYGYQKSPENRHKLVVDDAVSGNVIRMFDLFLTGTPARAIADIFNKECIESPNDHYYHALGKPNPNKADKHAWGSATIMSILKNRAYVGDTANGKRQTVSFKNHAVRQKPMGKWIIVENTHDPIIPRKRWEEAQRVAAGNRKNTTRRKANGEVSIFAGILKCRDCNANMVFNRKIRKAGADEFYRCGTYQNNGKGVCTMHRIDHDTLSKTVLADIQRYAVLAVDDEKRLIDRILKANSEFRDKSVSRYEKTIRETNNRIQEIDGIIQGLYEDKLIRMLSARYDEECSKLVVESAQLESELTECRKTLTDTSEWIARIKQCLSIDVLTRAIAVELIDRITVSEPYDSGGNKAIDIEIFYRFGLGSFDSTKENRA